MIQHSHKSFSTYLDPPDTPPENGKRPVEVWPKAAFSMAF